MNIAARPQVPIEEITDGHDTLLVPVERVEQSRQVHKESVSDKNLVIHAFRQLQPEEKVEIITSLLAELVQTDGTLVFMAPGGPKRIVATDVTDL